MNRRACIPVIVFASLLFVLITTLSQWKVIRTAYLTWNTTTKDWEEETEETVLLLTTTSTTSTTSTITTNHVVLAMNETDGAFTEGEINMQRKFENNASQATSIAHKNEKYEIKADSNLQNGDEDEKSSMRMKIVGFTDWQYLPIAIRWYDLLSVLGYTQHVIVAIDQKAASVLNQTLDHKHPNQTRFEFYPLHMETKINKTTSLTSSSSFQTESPREKTRSLWYHRIRYCLEQVRSGTSILLTDVDNIFVRYISPLSFANYDTVFAYSGKFPHDVYNVLGFTVCGGLIWFRATTPTIRYLELVLESCRNSDTKSTTKNHCDDQVEYNRVLAFQLNLKNYDSSILTNSSSYTNTTESPTIVGLSTWSNVTNQTIAIWTRDIAWRGPFDTPICPSLETNWISMPGSLPLEYSPNSQVRSWLTTTTTTLYPFSNTQRMSDAVLERIHRMNLWDEYCGINGTNQLLSVDDEHVKKLDLANARLMERITNDTPAWRRCLLTVLQFNFWY